MRALAVALALVMLAGCGSPAAKPATSDEVPTETVRTEEGDVVRVDLGALRGRVHDEVNYSLSGARVSVIGSDAFTTTGPDGRFKLVNLSAGEQRIQVLASGFHPLQQTVNVAAGATLQVDLLLLPLEARSGGYQPHLHDFWRGQDLYTVMDASFDPMQPGPRDGPQYPVQAGVAGPNTDGMRYRIPLPESEPGHPAIVLPGTKEIQITLDWGGTTQTVPDLGIAYDTPEQKAYIPGFNAIEMPAQQAGEVFVIRIEPRWQDSGHALWTDWRFFVTTQNHPASALAEYRPGLLIGEIHVKIELVRGDIVLDPPHNDWWQDNTTMTIHSTTGASTVLFGAPRTIKLPKDSVIPPGTGRIRFELQWTPGSVPLPPELDVAVLTADQNPDMTSLAMMRRFEPLENEAGRIVVEADLEPGWADPFYATSSGWIWYLYQDSPDPNRFVWPDSLTLALEVTLWKEMR